MDKILGVLGSVPSVQLRQDDDFSDRLSYRYTTGMLIVFALVVSTKQYVGDPISCWVPAHFTGNHEEYANNYCWVRNTYYLPYVENIPKEGESKNMIPYYQWIPIILLVQALLFYMPILVWRGLNNHSGIDVGNVIQSGDQFTNTDMVDKREQTLRLMTRQMDRYLSSQRHVRTSCTISMKNVFSRTVCFLCGRRRGNYLVALYMLVKLLHVANVIGHLFVLNAFLGQSFHIYGLDVIQQALEGKDWTQSARFPRVTMCDFKVRRLGNVQRYTVQCVLPINLFNEKIFLFVWFWLVFVAGATVLSLVVWALRVAVRVDRHRYIKKHLQLMDRLERDEDKRIAVKFVDDYLRQDGVFVMHLVGHNTNAITVTEFVCSLWDNYRARIIAEQGEKGGLASRSLGD